MGSAEKKMSKPTMAQVADVAGVSLKTVSRVLNNDSSTSPAMVRKVQAAAKSCGYEAKRPGTRQGPRRRSRRPIRKQQLLLLFSGKQAWLHSPIYSRTIHSIEESLRDEGWVVILQSALPETTIERLPKRIDGSILFSRMPLESMPPRVLRDLRGMGGVVRIMGERIEEDLFDHVLCNNHLIAALAAEYLLNQGHREIAVVGTAFGGRADDFISAVSAAGGRVQPFLRNDFINEQGVRQAPNHDAMLDTVQGLAALPVQPTAVFATADIIVMALYNALPRIGLRPGVDIEIIGVNNDALFLDCLHPRPASIDNHAEKVGRRAVEQMFWRLDHPRQPRQVVLIDPEIVAGRGAGSQ